jgi:ribosomal protein S18 acetylase RimI-like enzyme
VFGEHLQALWALEDAGFRYVDAILAPWLDLSTWQPRGFGVTRAASVADTDALRSIARRAFVTDRFHRDARFDREAADGVYEKWLATWLGDAGRDRVALVLTHDGAPAGFLLLDWEPAPGDAHGEVARIVLNAVDPQVAGRGHGYRLYCDALDIASRRARYCTADVAAPNANVVNIYARLGFGLRSGGDVTLHRWSTE